jgi:hypothetical protein
MSQKQAAWTSVGEFLQRREAHEKGQQLEWERSRWIAYSIFSPFLGKNKPRTPQQWVKFPWEHKTQTAPMVTINESQIKTLNDIFIDFQKKKA